MSCDPTYVDGKKTTELEFCCEICDASFKQKSKLKQHKGSVHKGKKQFRCETCGSNFASKQSLKMHISAVHKGKKPFKFLC